MSQSLPRKAVPNVDRTSADSSIASISTAAHPPSIIAQDADDIAAHHDDDLPPTYTGPSPSSSRTPTSAPSSSVGPAAALVPIDFSLYPIPGAILSKDRTTITVNDPKYSFNAQALLDLIQTQSKLPPHPQIRIVGEDFSQRFDIRISMLRYIVRPPDSRGSSNWNYVKLIGNGEVGWRGGREQSTFPAPNAGLKGWVSRYTGDDVKNKKSFSLKKQVTNWNTAYLEGQIRNLVASTNYNSPVKVTFPVTYANLVVQVKANKPWHEKIAAAFQPSQNKRYEVVTAVWPYAALAPEDARSQGNHWAVQSEMQFWAEWKDVIRSAVLERRNGWVTLEDHIEMAMGSGWAEQEKDF